MTHSIVPLLWALVEKWRSSGGYYPDDVARAQCASELADILAEAEHAEACGIYCGTNNVQIPHEQAMLTCALPAGHEIHWPAPRCVHGKTRPHELIVPDDCDVWCQGPTE